jgi:hypothetical protein
MHWELLEGELYLEGDGTFAFSSLLDIIGEQ